MNGKSKYNLKRVSIVVPVYADWSSLKKNIKSLQKFVGDSAEVIFVNDCGPEADLLERKIKKSISTNDTFSYHRNDKNLGFVKSCNNAVMNLINNSNDVMLLNSDAVVTEGFLEQMHTVLYLRDNIGAVCPRSNSATIFSVPMRPTNKKYTMRSSYRLYKKIAPKIPQYYISPIAHGFCMLIRREVINKYGLFDEVYGKGYGEENDFCMRIREKGYLCAVSNWSYVFHYKARSFTEEKRTRLVYENEQILDKRYPGYRNLVQEYLKSDII